MPYVSMAAFTLSAPHSRPNPDAPLDRPYTLRNPEPFVVEQRHRALITGSGALSFTLPAACGADPRPAACGETGGFRLRDTSGGKSLAFRPVIGQEWRHGEESVFATEAGAVLSGSKGPVSFHLDGRMFAGNGGDSVALDGEPLDRQAANATGTVDYVSFARFRGNMSLDLPFGRFVVARDAAHWGPGLSANLMLNQAAVPFNQAAFTTTLGPLSVTSLYGDLAVGRARATREQRHLHAHRYELSVTGNLTVAISEQLILGEGNEPFLFTPIFPLFIAKGFLHEDSNNGNIAFDAAYRFGGHGMVYGEFLLDDMESPSSILTRNYNQNKWAWMAGVHLAADAYGAQWGSVLEYSRVQPWVYTHFSSSPAQAANMGLPLGHPHGPNSQWMTAKAYGRLDGKGYAGIKVSALWKGNDAGSGVFDPYDSQRHLERNAFLEGVDAGFTVSPYFQCSLGGVAFSASADAGAVSGASARIEYRY